MNVVHSTRADISKYSFRVSYLAIAARVKLRPIFHAIMLDRLPNT